MVAWKLLLTSMLICLAVSLSASASPTSTMDEPTVDTDSVGNYYPIIHHFSVNAGVDYVATSIDSDLRKEVPVEDRIGVHTAVPVHLRYSFSLTDPKVRHFLPGGYQGVGIGLINIGAAQVSGFNRAVRNIGYPVIAYVFQGGPFYRIDNHLSLSYEWNFGASFGWKPYCDDNKIFNIYVGSRVNAYLNIGFYVNYQLNRSLALFAGVSVSHFSNGNTSYPNPGVNSFGLRLGVTQTLNPNERFREVSTPDTTAGKKTIYDISIWGAARKRLFRGIDPPVLLPGRYACIGLSFAPMLQLNKWWKIGGSLDWMWDKSSNLKGDYISGTSTDDIKFHSPSFIRQNCIGLAAHAELRMPVFALNVGCGYNLLAPPEHRGTYQNLTLKTYLTENVFLNIGYELRNFHQQGNLMLGAGVTIF